MVREDITTILFDIGGVLVDLQGTPFRSEWLQAADSKHELMSYWHRSSAVREFETGEISVEVFAERFILEAGLQVAPTDFIKHFFDWPAKLFDGVPEMLLALGKRYRLAALSNSNALHWSKLTQEMGLGSYIEDCVSSHKIGLMKPDRQALIRTQQDQ